MKPTDFGNFCEVWALAHETMAAGKVFSQNAMSSIFDDFEDYDFLMVDAALKHHRKSAKFAPTAFDIIDLLDAGSKHVGADEAWAIAKVSMNSSESVVTTAEIIQAAGAAEDVYNPRDENPARMAFRDVYNRITKLAKKPQWFVSRGDDKEQTESVALEGIRLGRLPIGSESQYRIEAPTVTAQFLIEGYVANVCIRDEERAKIKTLLTPEPKKKWFGEVIVDPVYDRTNEALPDFLLDVDSTYFYKTPVVVVAEQLAA